MKALQLHLVVILFAIALAHASDYRNMCRLFKSNTKLQLPGSCDQYIVCKGDSGQILRCDLNAKYDAKQQKCVTDLSTAELCDNRCWNSADDTFKAKHTNCRAYYYCKYETATESYCGDDYFFDQDEQMCVYPKNSKCIQNVNNICELVADKTLFRDENDCSKYYKCEKNRLTKVDCKKQYFNVEMGKCVERSTVKCTAHHATADTCLKNKLPYVGLKSDGATCPGYYICANKGLYAHDLQPIWYQCAAGKFFDETKKQCLAAVDVKCAYNRCEGRGNSTVTSGKNNCRNYLECQNNVVLKEVSCDHNYFFDERLGACVPYIIYDKCCDDEKTHS